MWWRSSKTALPPDHQDRERARDGRPSRRPATRRRRRRGSALVAHGEDVIRLAVERDRSRAVHRLEVLLDNETRRTLFLDDGERSVALRTECLHGRRVEG